VILIIIIIIIIIIADASVAAVANVIAAANQTTITVVNKAFGDSTLRPWCAWRDRRLLPPPGELDQT